MTCSAMLVAWSAMRSRYPQSGQHLAQVLGHGHRHGVEDGRATLVDSVVAAKDRVGDLVGRLHELVKRVMQIFSAAVAIAVSSASTSGFARAPERSRRGGVEIHRPRGGTRPVQVAYSEKRHSPRSSRLLREKCASAQRIRIPARDCADRGRRRGRSRLRLGPPARKRESVSSFDEKIRIATWCVEFALPPVDVPRIESLMPLWEPKP